MHIKQLHVTRYGPMRPFAHDDLRRFTVVHGPNERVSIENLERGTRTLVAILEELAAPAPA